jgi:hypothetical protein
MSCRSRSRGNFLASPPGSRGRGHAGSLRSAARGRRDARGTQSRLSSTRRSIPPRLLRGQRVPGFRYDLGVQHPAHGQIVRPRRCSLISSRGRTVTWRSLPPPGASGCPLGASSIRRGRGTSADVDPLQTIATDLSRFNWVFADIYFRTVSEALKRRDPNHLYLGSRFWKRPQEAVSPCARHCDVVSFTCTCEIWTLSSGSGSRRSASRRSSGRSTSDQ